MNRPHTTVILAMTADGKIADVGRSPARFGSAADKTHLESQIALVDGVIFGAGTLGAYGTTLVISQPHWLQLRQQLAKPPQPVHIVASASGNLEPQWRFFTQSVPRWLLTTTAGAKIWQEKPESYFERLLIAEGKFTQGKSLDWIFALEQIEQLGLKKLAILGGGELVASLLAVDAVDEFWLTVCPFIFGGRDAPTPVGGTGFSPQQARRLQLLEVKRVDEEVFLHYRRQR